MQGHTEGSQEVCTTMSRSTWCWLVCPFSCPRLAPGPCQQLLLVGQRSTPLLSFGYFLFFHLYPWCSCFKISLEQNMKGVVISFLSSSLPYKLPHPAPHHAYAHSCKCVHTWSSSGTSGWQRRWKGFAWLERGGPT